MNVTPQSNRPGLFKRSMSRKTKGGGEGVGLVKRHKRHRKQSKWEPFGEEEGGYGKLRKPHSKLREPLLSQWQRKARPPLRLKKQM